jgi:hypothetical protein
VQGQQMRQQLLQMESKVAELERYALLPLRCPGAHLYLTRMVSGSSGRRSSISSINSIKAALAAAAAAAAKAASAAAAAAAAAAVAAGEKSADTEVSRTSLV